MYEFLLITLRPENSIFHTTRMTDYRLKTLTLLTDMPLKEHETRLFRGAMIHMTGSTQTLMHNHIGNGFRYSYPLVQYKIINSRAAIVGVNEGAELLAQTADRLPATVAIGKELRTMGMEAMHTGLYTMQMADHYFAHQMRRWMPLNSDNYRSFVTAKTAQEREMMLENILKGNILSFLKGTDIFICKELRCKIMAMSQPYTIRNKQNAMIAFDIDFECNMLLPEHIGIGKNASIGCGIVNSLTL